MGIDPGKHGAIAVISDVGLQLKDLAGDLAAIERQLYFVTENDRVAIEFPRPVPKQGAQGIATFWRQHGFIEGVVRSRDAEVVMVTPQEWKRAVFFDTPESRKYKSLDKPASYALASRLWPGSDFGERETADRAEAALIAYHLKTRSH